MVKSPPALGLVNVAFCSFTHIRILIVSSQDEEKEIADADNLKDLIALAETKRLVCNIARLLLHTDLITNTVFFYVYLYI